MAAAAAMLDSSTLLDTPINSERRYPASKRLKLEPKQIKNKKRNKAAKQARKKNRK